MGCRGTPICNAPPCAHQHCPYRSHSAPEAGSARGRAGDTGGGRAALSALGCGPSSPAKPELGPQYFYLFSVNSFSNSCINPEKAAFSSHPLKSLNFPQHTSRSARSLPGRKNQNKTKQEYQGKKSNKPKPTNQTSKHQKADEETLYEFSCEPELICFVFRRKPSKGTNQREASAVRPARPGSASCLYYYLLLLLLLSLLL